MLRPRKDIVTASTCSKAKLIVAATNQKGKRCTNAKTQEGHCDRLDVL
jgi:hypothetical protein